MFKVNNKETTFTPHFDVVISGMVTCVHKRSTQPAFTCSKLTIETLEQGVKYVQS